MLSHPIGCVQLLPILTQKSLPQLPAKAIYREDAKVDGVFVDEEDSTWE